jgi:hypothetical protein
MAPRAVPPTKRQSPPARAGISHTKDHLDMVWRGSSRNNLALTRTLRGRESSTLPVHCRKSWGRDHPIRHEAVLRRTSGANSLPTPPKSVTSSSALIGRAPQRSTRPSPNEVPEAKKLDMRPPHRIETLSGPWTSSGKLSERGPLLCFTLIRSIHGEYERVQSFGAGGIECALPRCWQVKKTCTIKSLAL